MFTIIKLPIALLLLCVAGAALAAPLPSPLDSGQFQRGGRFQRAMQPRQDARDNRPITLPAGAREVHDVAYGSDPAQSLDVYLPAHAAHAPIIFMVHGGGWQRGDKANANVVQNKLDYFLPRGFIFVSTNYRMVPKVGVMTESADVASALAYVQQHAAGWGGDGSSVIVMGHSAGAQLAMLLTSAPSIRQAAGVLPWRATIALDSGGYDIVQIMRQPHFKLYDPVFGDSPALWKEASPTLQLQAAPPVPVLLVCSTLRRDSCDQATAYADKARGLGGHATVAPVALRHAQIDADVGLPGPLTTSIADFIRAQGAR